MSEYYLGEIRMFGGNYAPENWVLCDGSLLSTSDYSYLFSLIGTTYGGNGQTTFAVPDLRGRIPVGQGAGPGLTPRVLGQSFGVEQAPLPLSALPAHNHLVNVVPTAAGDVNPGPNVALAATTAPAKNYTVVLPAPPAPRVMADAAIGQSGAPGSPAHPNVMPSFAVTFIMATHGIYPVHP